MTDNYRLYNYKTGTRYSDHPNLEGAMLSAVRHVENGQQVRWNGGPLVWFGYVNRRKLPTFGVDGPKSNNRKTPLEKSAHGCT